MKRFALLPLAWLTASCAATPAQVAQSEAVAAREQAKLDEKLAGYTRTGTQQCIRPIRANSTVYGDTIIYSDTNARLYVTRTTGGCFGLSRDDIIVTQSFSSQSCQGDIVRTVDRVAGFTSGACSFGEFAVYTRDRRR